MAGHPGSQRMTDDEKSLVSDLVAAGVPARQELTILQHKYPSSLATARTIYNNKAANRLQQLAGRSPIQALIDELEANSWTFEFKTDVNGHLTPLFLAHPAMIRLTLRYGSKKFSKKRVVVEYLYKTWIIHKEKFVHAWTNQVQHFGNTSTSAAEDAHAALKRYLQTSTGNLDLVLTRMTQAVENQAREIEASLPKKESESLTHSEMHITLSN
uniref:Uncharacterized protein AlNc14C18G1913 n=1 Tax=Albugo laibachii Nc14 TaxID=890382 RepID=F0W4U3_9STRA|nr:conserved hypothetical protein [Albugo laibachii Nc14]|eukprot:CCA16131.1 conserved hypothetical protein [Albugo laibachii Nc14]